MALKKFVWLEDDATLMSHSRQIFLDHGFQFHSCTTPSKALEFLRKPNGYNNLLLDIDFPNNRKEGLVFLEQIKDILPELKVVIFTAYHEYEDAVQVTKKQLAANYIPKPIPIDVAERQRFFQKLHDSFQEEKEETKKKKQKKKVTNSPPTKQWQIIGVVVAIIAIIVAVVLFVLNTLINNDIS